MMEMLQTRLHNQRKTFRLGLALIAIPMLVVPLLLSGAGFPESTGMAPLPEEYNYVGVDVCKMCHRNPTKGNQFGQWEGSAHAKAFANLASEESKKIAQEKGAGDPQQAAECLSCHVTAYEAPAERKAGTYKLEDGVGCESCHGPGSAFKVITIMRDREKALTSGMIVADEKTCLKCHNEKSPTFEGFNFEEMWKKILHPDPSKG